MKSEKKLHRHNPLFFQKDGSMDLGQFILAVTAMTCLIVFVVSATGIIPGPTIAAWSFMGSFSMCAYIAGAAKDRAALIANSRAIGEVSRGIANSRPDLPSKTDDERNDNPA